MASCSAATPAKIISPNGPGACPSHGRSGTGGRPSSDISTTALVTNSVNVPLYRIYDAFGHMIMKDPASRRDSVAGSARRGGPRNLILHPGNTRHAIPARAMVRGGHGGPGRPG